MIQIREPLRDRVERARRLLTPNYRPQPVIFTGGQGPYLFDTEQKKYLDFAAGIAVSALGHGHPVLSAAIAEQARSVLHVSNLYFTGPEIELAEKLTSLSFADRVFFANSGTEANEAAMKLARRYMRLVRGEDRFEFVCAERSFHGRTWASISATGQPKYHRGFEPLVPGFVHVPYGDLAAIRGAITDKTCAVFVEPIQGEGGVVVPPDDYLPGLRALCDEQGVLLILDEVQTGVGRTGRWWAHEHTGVTPDIMTLAKGLGGGVPVGAMLCSEAVSAGFAPGAHASTFGGNPLACAASLAVLRVIEQEGLCDHVEEIGAYLRDGLATLATKYDALGEVRGRGLLTGIVFDPDALAPADIVAACRERGLLLTIAGGEVLRLTPPLIVGRSHVDDALDMLDAAVGAVGRHGGTS